MFSFLAKRLLAGLLTVFVSSIIIFGMVRVIPGDPLAAVLGTERHSAEAVASYRKLYGLDRPLHEQYVSWVGAVASGDLGVSLISRADVAPLVVTRIPRTVYLISGGMGVALLIAIPAGIAAARRRGSPTDNLLTSATTLTLATPEFFLGLLLAYLFSVRLGWLPSVGFVSPSTSFVGFVRSMILPWLTIGLVAAAVIVRVLRSSLIDVLGQDYIRTARARGFGEQFVVRHHALRNASIPTVTVVGLQVGYLLGGAIIVEVLFSFPGMGLLTIKAITQRDYPVVQAALLFFAVGFVVVNILTDLAYRFLDPRMARA